LRAYRITNASLLADKVVAAARTQTVTVAGEATAAVIIGQLAADLQSVNDRIAAVDELIEAVLARHELAEVITSLPAWARFSPPSSSPTPAASTPTAARAP
jgi:hypothetical protein